MSVRFEMPNKEKNIEQNIPVAKHVLENDAQLPLLIDELHKIANQYMHKENASHTLQATALVNEAYLSLLNANVELKDPLHFYALAATHMRRILVDHARSKMTNKRSAQAFAVTANDEVLIDQQDTTSLVLLDEVLTRFCQFDERGARIYEMRLFAGLTNQEIASVLEISLTTVERDMKVARAWVLNQLTDVD
jgi:RNA polymerase sigma factor (TIGR02999 family)